MVRGIYAIILGALLASGIALAEESKPVVLTAEQMDTITAGTLGLPNGNTVQDNFDNPAPNVNGYIGICDAASGLFCHPALTRRSDTALGATAGHGPSVGGVNDGPWVATDAAGGPLVFVCEVC